MKLSTAGCAVDEPHRAPSAGSSSPSASPCVIPFATTVRSDSIEACSRWRHVAQVGSAFSRRRSGS
jgi:hypothetical protein